MFVGCPLFVRLLHDARTGQAHEEAHSGQGDYLKAMVFGGLDGILTSFAIVAGAAGTYIWRFLWLSCTRWKTPPAGLVSMQHVPPKRRVPRCISPDTLVRARKEVPHEQRGIQY